MVDMAYQVFVDLDATALEGGSIFLGQPDADPEQSPIAVFWDEAQTIQATQPLRTSGGVIVRDGTPADVFASVSAYSIRVRNRAGSVVWYKATTGGTAASRLTFPIPAGPPGADSVIPGPANSTYTSLALLKAAPISNRSYTLVTSAGRTDYAYVTGDFTGRADDVNVVKLDAVPLTTGALVRQGAASVSYTEPGTGAVPLDAQTKIATVGISPEGFGAIGNVLANDTAALQAALNTGLPVRLTTGKRYLVTGRLDWNASNVSLTGGGTIVAGSSWNFAADTDSNGTHMRALFVNGNNVTLSGINFDLANAPQGTAVENGALWVTGSGCTVTGCQFVGNPKGTAIWFLASATEPTVNACKFYQCSGAVFAKTRNPVITNNSIIDATDAAIAINGRNCVGAVISGNSIANNRAASIPSMIAVEEGPSGWTITGNTCIGCSGGGIALLNTLDFTPVQGGVIANNVVDGRRFNGVLQSNSSPSALFSVADTYVDWIAHDNKFINVPSGNPNSRAAVIASSGGSFHNNRVDGTATSGLSALITIAPGTGGITIRDNETSVASGGRHYLFAPGSYGEPQDNPNSKPLQMPFFIGGKFYGGAEGINAELNVGSITNLMIGIENITDKTVANLTNAATILGDRGTFLNAGAWAMPHRIGLRTEMHCNAVPSAAGRMPFQAGDKFYYLSPSVGGSIGVVRIAGGFNAFGAIS